MPVSRLVRIVQPTTIDVRLSVHEQPTSLADFSFSDEHILSQSEGLTSDGIPYLTTAWYKEQLIIRFYTGAEVAFFVVSPSGEKLDIFYPKAISFLEIQSFLLGTVMGIILRLQKRVCLHAAAVNINGKAAAFIGEQTAGKSTLVSALAARGCSVLSDDIVALRAVGEGQYEVETGYPFIRLWKNSVEHFSELNTDSLTRVFSTQEKYFVPLSLSEAGPWSFQAKPLSLDRVYYLNYRNTTNTIRIQKTAAVDAFLKLKQNTYGERFVDAVLQRKDFEVFGHLARQGQVCLLDRPNDLSTMGEVCAVIEEDMG